MKHRMTHLIGPATLGIAYCLAGGCATHNAEMNVRALPAIDDQAAAILADNAMNARPGDIQLVASDHAGQEMFNYAIAYAKARATGQPMPAQFATVWLSAE